LNNSQTFSIGSAQYAKHRPTYPDELFRFFSEISVSHESVWDCATGNGQAAAACAKYFSHIEATDISSEQIQHCIPHPKITYSISPAETTPFADHSFDCIMVAQAYHWFDQEKFSREADRILKPKGILAIFGYAFFEIDPEIDFHIKDSFLPLIDPFWAAGNRLLMSGYKDVTLPFNEIPDPKAFAITVGWNLPQLTEYLRTWSGVKRYVKELGGDPVADLETAIKPLWGKVDMVKSVKMPLYLRVSRKSS